MLLSSTIESAFMMAAGQDGNIPFAFGTSSNSESSASLTADTNVGRPVNKGLGMLQMSGPKWSAQMGSPRLWCGLRRCCKTLSQKSGDLFGIMLLTVLVPRNHCALYPPTLTCARSWSRYGDMGCVAGSWPIVGQSETLMA